MELEKSLALIAGEACVKKDEPMLPHCTFRAGGSAEYFVTAEDVQDVVKDTLGHRVKLGQRARAQGMNMDGAMKALIRTVQVPRL